MEHMTITHTEPVRVIADSALQINPDIKRELSFYNVARANVMKAMEICVQAKVPIDRPEDFFAEMIKSDDHMKQVKSRLLKQQQKIQKFEEKKGAMENKKFHKAIKQFTQQKRH
jgi:rRNA-processing protein EBP2